jgi:hypothetical protein
VVKRKILVISANEPAGKWFRFALGGRKTGMSVTVVADLHEAIRALKRSKPNVVIFIEERPETTDDRLMLLRALLLIEKQSRQNTLAILYDLADGGMTMYHNIHFPQAGQEDVALAAREGVRCPLFGYLEEAAPVFPPDCGFLPLMAKSARLAAGAANGMAEVPGGTRQKR